MIISNMAIHHNIIQIVKSIIISNMATHPSINWVQHRGTKYGMVVWYGIVGFNVPIDTL